MAISDFRNVGFLTPIKKQKTSFKKIQKIDVKNGINVIQDSICYVHAKL